MNRSGKRRRLIVLAISIALLLAASGCAGRVRPMSWTGLTVLGEKLYAADLEQVIVLNASDGEPVWTFPKDPAEDSRGIFYVTPAVGEKHVVVASQTPGGGLFSQPRHTVWALDLATGKDLWHFDGAAAQHIEGGALSGDLFVIGDSDGNVYALDAESGVLRWTFETGYRVWATPLIASDTVYVGSMDRHLYALRLSDGQVRWDFPADGAFAGTPALYNDTLYIGAFDDQLYAVDAQTGTERWRFPGENWFWGTPAAYSDTVYAADVSGNVYAVDAETGEQIWTQKLLDAREQGVPLRAGPALAEDGSRLFIGGQNGTLYALDTGDGFVIWSAEGEGQVLSSPVVSGSLVYETLIYGPQRIRAFHVDNGREMWAYSPEVEEQE